MRRGERKGRGLEEKEEERRCEGKEEEKSIV